MFRSLFGFRPGSDDVDTLRERIRLYVQVMLAIDLLAHFSDQVMPRLVENLTYPEYPPVTTIMRVLSTAIVVVAWILTRFTKPSRTMLIMLESAVTLSLTLVYVHIAAVQMSETTPQFASVFTMFGIILLLGVRASLVPSPVLRTVVIGATSMACVFGFGRESIRVLDPLIFDGLTFIAVAYVMATAVTSHVIYGLRREVREAMQLGQYTLEEKLGEGGMGAVYRARHAMLRRKAAIKLIRADFKTDSGRHAQARRRFEREADATASLQSPHTVELYDFGVSTDGAFYYVMELLDGIDLESAVARYGPLPPARVVHLLRQACESLEEAHAAGLVHRDIKPANLMICRHGVRYDHMKVLDFGLVALGHEPRSSDAKITAEEVVAGTPAYLAPEIASDSATVDGRADIYALGCVAFQMLTGQAPFERESAMATILAHMN
ncbi:MAG: serine/threonine protein kinase, partial [Gemmatimonadetes bacterium]|nr:serine/threonine protein kinase [Gemmatimonadota bacterium]